MTPDKRNLFRIAVALVIMSLAACECDDGTGGPTGGACPTTPPTVEGIPASTNLAALPVSGFTESNTTVWVAKDGADGVLIAGPAFGAWSGEVALSEGENKLVFDSRYNPATPCVPSREFVVVLDSIAPDAPVLSSEIDECSSATSVELEGTAEAGTTLNVEVDGTVVTSGETVGGDGSWSWTVNLAESETVAVSVTVTDEAGNTSDPLTLNLTQGISTPTVDPVPELTDQFTLVLSGSKEAGIGVTLQMDGDSEWTVIVPVDDTTEWTYDLPLGPAETTFSISGIDSEGNASCGLRGPFTVRFTAVCAPHVDVSGFASPTNDPQLLVPGTKCAGTGIWLWYDDETSAEATERVPIDESDVFGFFLTLVEGDNTFFVQTRDATDEMGPSDGPFTVVLDTTPPAAPVFDPEPASETDAAEATLTGHKDTMSSLCVRRDQEPACTEVVAVDASEDFTMDLVLNSGDNYVCISSMDALGNASEETCVTIVFSPGPGVTIQEPVEGGIIGEGTLTITATATGADGTEEGVASVEICLNADCGPATNSPEGSITWVREVTPNGLVSGESQTISAEATSEGGLVSTDEIQVVYLAGGLLLSTSAPEAPATRPRVAIDGAGRVHVVWSDGCSQFGTCTDSQAGNLPNDIFHRVFDGGAWSDITLISNAVGDGDSRNPVIAAGQDGNIHVVWQDNGDILGSGEDFDLMHRMLDITTDVWTDTLVLTEGSDVDDEDADLAASPDGSLHLVYEHRTTNADLDVYHLSAVGATITGPTLISDDANDGSSRTPAISIDRLGDAYIVWQDDGDIGGSGTDRDIYLRSLSGGSMSPIIVVSDNALDGESILPDVVVGIDDIVHIVWQDSSTVLGSGDDLDIFHRTYVIGDGLTPYNLVSSGAADLGSEEPSLTFDPDSGDVFVLWVETSTADLTANIVWSRYLGAFTPPQLMTSGFTGLSEWPDVAFDPAISFLHIVWEDETDLIGNGPDRDVFYTAVDPF